MAHADLLSRRAFGQTARRAAWWVQPLAVFLGLSAFIVYSTWADSQVPWSSAAGRATLISMNELIFEVVQEDDGGFVAECLTEAIFTQGDTWQELRDNVKEAVEAFFFDRAAPGAIRLHLVRDELVALG